MIKKFVSRKFPSLFRLIKSYYYLFYETFLGRTQTEIVFNKIYKRNIWGDNDSVSGAGSNLKNTEGIRKELPDVIRNLNVEVFLDIPCGDFFWMKHLNLPIKKYIGADVVKELIENNTKKFADENRSFLVIDVTRDKLPIADIVFCRDCLPHLSNEYIIAALRQIKKSNSKYLLTSTYSNQEINEDLPTGRFHKINLELPPFNLPKPLLLIKDECITSIEFLQDKSLGLWKISDIPDF